MFIVRNTLDIPILFLFRKRHSFKKYFNYSAILLRMCTGKQAEKEKERSLGWLTDIMTNGYNFYIYLQCKHHHELVLMEKSIASIAGYSISNHIPFA